MTSAVNEKGKDEQGGAKGNDETAIREGEREKKRVDKLARERINEREKEIKRQCNREWEWMGCDVMADMAGVGLTRRVTRWRHWQVWR